MKRLLAAFLLAAVQASATPALAASDDDIIRDVFYSFTAGEQRLIQTMWADPAQDSAFQQGLQTVIAAKGDPKQLEAAKLKFRSNWTDRVNDFSTKYQAQDATLVQGMAKLPKPTAAQFHQTLPWLAKLDNEHWSGGLAKGASEKMNPYEANYSLAGLSGLSDAQRTAMIDRLESNSWAPTGSVLNVMLDENQKKLSGDLGDVSRGYAARSRTVKEQLARAEAALRTVSNDLPQTGQSPEDARNAADAVFDGAAPGERRNTPPVVVGDQSGQPDPDAVPGGEVTQDRPTQEAANRTGEVTSPGLKPSTGNPGTAPRASLGGRLRVPPPKTDDAAFQSRKGSSTAGIGAILKKPAVAMGIGAVGFGLVALAVGAGPVGLAVAGLFGLLLGGMIAKKA